MLGGQRTERIKPRVLSVLFSAKFEGYVNAMHLCCYSLWHSEKVNLRTITSLTQSNGVRISNGEVMCRA